METGRSTTDPEVRALGASSPFWWMWLENRGRSTRGSCHHFFRACERGTCALRLLAALEQDGVSGVGTGEV